MRHLLSFEEIEEICAIEARSRKYVTDMEEIPSSYELITNEWLQAIFCPHVPGAKVIGHHLDKPDDGTYNRRRIFIQYNEPGREAGLPESVFCKSTQSAKSRYVVGRMGVSSREIAFYRKIRPLVDIEAPTLYFGNTDEDSLNSILLLSDLGVQATFCDQTTEISHDLAKSQVDLLARLHSTFYMQSAENPPLSHLVKLEDYFARIEKSVKWSECCANGFKAAKEVIPANLYERENEIWPATERAIDQHRGATTTFLHNDPHLRNWYILNDTMGLADWGGVIGHWSRDLAYAISTSLSTENRRLWEMGLIERYVSRFNETASEKISLDEAFSCYKTQLFTALAFWTGTLTPAPGMPDMQPEDASLLFIGRITHAIDDLSSLNAV